ncbi:MAG: WG repeat-containing protein [Oscillospiraceae bacterium]|nr:WG repeat-containing protein [Oscillospiraceae bacterium]
MTKTKSILLFAAAFALMLLVAGCSQRVPVNDVEINKDHVIETIWAIYPHLLDQASNGGIKECNMFYSGYAAVDCQSGYTVIIDKSGINAFESIGDIAIGGRQYEWGFDRKLPIVQSSDGDSYTLNITGREILPPEYAFDTAPHETSILTTAKGKNGKYGLANRIGQWVVAPIYNSIRIDRYYITTDEHIANATFGSVNGLITRDLEFVSLAPSSVSIGIYNDDGYARTFYGDSIWRYYNFIDIDGNALLSDDIKARIQYTPSLSEGMILFYQNGLYGYMNLDGKTVIEPKYQIAGDFFEGLAYVQTRFERGAYIDISGKTVITISSSDYGSPFVNGMARQYVKNRGSVRVGIIDNKGKWLVKPKYDSCTYDNKNNIWLLNNTKGEYEFTDVYFVETGILITGYVLVDVFSPTTFTGWIEKTEKCYFVDVSNSITRTEFDYISYIGDMSEGLLSVKQDGLWGYIDLNGNLIIDFQFDKVQPFSEGLAAVCLDGKWGYIANPLVYPAWDPDEIKRAELLGLIDAPASDESITCGEFVSLLERAFKMEDGTLNSIVSEPGTLLTRGAVAAFISHAAEEQGKYYRYFLPDSDDRASISEELKFQIGFAIQTGIVKLHDYNFNEYSEVQRDEAYRILLRTFEYLLS